MLGSGFNSQLLPSPNAAATSQQQPPSDSMQLMPNPEHSHMWMQLQQEINRQRTASSAPFNPQQGGGPAGPQNMQNGMIRPPMNVADQSMAGFSGPPVSPGPLSLPNPAMVYSSAHMTPEVSPVRFFTSWTGWRLFFLVDAELQRGNEKAPPQGNGTTSYRHQR